MFFFTRRRSLWTYSMEILLIEELLLLSIGSLPHYLQIFFHPRWLAGFLPSTVGMYLLIYFLDLFGHWFVCLCIHPLILRLIWIQPTHSFNYLSTSSVRRVPPCMHASTSASIRVFHFKSIQFNSCDFILCHIIPCHTPLKTNMTLENPHFQ